MNHKNGFTLIELMIVVAIVAILAGVAYPSYSAYIQRAHRTDAKTALLENAQFMERNFTVAGRYDQDSAGANISLPVTQSPRSGTAIYNIELSAVGTSSYTLSASPVAGGPMANDSCGVLSVTQTGAKTDDDINVDCWAR